MRSSSVYDKRLDDNQVFIQYHRWLMSIGHVHKSLDCLVMHIKHCVRVTNNGRCSRGVRACFVKTQAFEVQIERKKMLRACRRGFARRLSREHICSSTVHSCTQPPVTCLVNMDERSNYWRHVDNSTFTSHDWTENLRMSHNTFIYLRDELRASVERNYTTMRQAIPVE